jgi:ABC-type Fe3+-hydroxamate transport system substrate-binding protein
MLRLLGILVLLLTLVVIIVACTGASLPLAHVAQRTVVVPAPPQKVFALIDNMQDYPSWRTGIKSVVKLPDVLGKPHWQENSQMGAILEVVTDDTAPTHRVVTIDPGLPFGGTWTFDLAPVAAGTSATNLTIREDGTIHNVFYRFMERYLFGYTATIDQYEKDLVKAAQ